MNVYGKNQPGIVRPATKRLKRKLSFQSSEKEEARQATQPPARSCLLGYQSTEPKAGREGLRIYSWRVDSAPE